MIRRDGYVKVLDFGLAKLIEGSSGRGERGDGTTGRGENSPLPVSQSPSVPPPLSSPGW